MPLYEHCASSYNSVRICICPSSKRSTFLTQTDTSQPNFKQLLFFFLHVATAESEYKFIFAVMQSADSEERRKLQVAADSKLSQNVCLK